MSPLVHSSSPSPAPHTVRDREWIARVRAGDGRAFEEMFRTYKNDLVAFVAALVRSHEVAQEVVQDLFLRIWQQRDLWEVAGPLNAYLFRVARHRAISYLRRERVEVRFQETEAVAQRAFPSAPEPTDARAVANDLKTTIERIVDGLPERCREVFRLSRHHFLTNMEIAAIMEISVKTVEMQMTRALAALRAGLAGWRD